MEGRVEDFRKLGLNDELLNVAGDLVDPYLGFPELGAHGIVVDMHKQVFESSTTATLSLFAPRYCGLI